MAPLQNKTALLAVGIVVLLAIGGAALFTREKPKDTTPLSFLTTTASTTPEQTATMPVETTTTLSEMPSTETIDLHAIMTKIQPLEWSETIKEGQTLSGINVLYFSTINKVPVVIMYGELYTVTGHFGEIPLWDTTTTSTVLSNSSDVDLMKSAMRLVFSSIILDAEKYGTLETKEDLFTTIEFTYRYSTSATMSLSWAGTFLVTTTNKIDARGFVVISAPYVILHYERDYFAAESDNVSPTTKITTSVLDIVTATFVMEDAE